MPALWLLATVYVAPTSWTIRTSFSEYNPLAREPVSGDATTENYREAFDQGLLGDFGFALSLSVIPLLIVLLVAPLLAFAAHRAGRVARRLTRVALVLPLAAFAPAALAVAQFGDRGVHTAYWLGTFGVITALGTLLYLAVLRRLDPRRSPWPAMAVTGGIAAVAVLAAALQEFTFTHLHRTGDVGTPMEKMFQFGFVYIDFGVGAAYSTLLLLVLVLLGAGVAVLTVLSGLRLEFDDRTEPAVSTSTGARVTWSLVAGALVVAVLVVLWLVVDVWDLTRFDQLNDAGTGQILRNTWVPPLLSTAIGVTAAALAAFGISGLRPAGRHSEWLLVPFGLFMFVGVGPLTLRAYAAGRTAGWRDTILALVPPTRLSIIALFVLALLFRGQALRREWMLQEGRPMPWSRVVLPVLPMLGLAYLVSWVVQAQGLLWQLVSGVGEFVTGPVTLVQFLSVGGPTATLLPYGLVLPIGVLLVLVAAGVGAQLFYLDRLALRVGRPERDHPPRT